MASISGNAKNAGVAGMHSLPLVDTIVFAFTTRDDTTVKNVEERGIKRAALIPSLVYASMETTRLYAKSARVQPTAGEGGMS